MDVPRFRRPAPKATIIRNFGVKGISVTTHNVADSRVKELTKRKVRHFRPHRRSAVTDTEVIGEVSGRDK